MSPPTVIADSLMEPEKPFVITALVDGRPRCWMYECCSIALMVAEVLMRTGSVPASHERVTNVSLTDRRGLIGSIDTHDRRLERAEAALAQIADIVRENAA